MRYLMVAGYRIVANGPIASASKAGHKTITLISIGERVRCITAPDGEEEKTYRSIRAVLRAEKIGELSQWDQYTLPLGESA
jgi:hypothetical protein